MLVPIVLSKIFFLASFLPEVEDPWPSKIGIEFLFQAGGAGGWLMDLVKVGAPEVDRNRAIRWGGLWGFRIGAGFYVLSLLVQIGSSL
jgi:hypothetical protein